MTKEDIEKQFFLFLEENNSKYIYLQNNNYYYIKIYNYKEILNSRDPRNLILQAFTWCETNQGHEYWLSLNKKWNLIYDEYILKNKKKYERLGNIWND